MYNVSQTTKDLFNSVGSIKRGYLSIVPLSNEGEEIIDESQLESFEILDDIYTPRKWNNRKCNSKTDFNTILSRNIFTK